MADTFAATVKSRRDLKPLWALWNVVSLARRPFTADLLEELQPKNLDPLLRDVLRYCLLFGDRTLRLHEILKVPPNRWRADLPDARRRDLVSTAMRQLFTYHAGRFEKLKQEDDASAIIESMEAFFFATGTGDEALLASMSPHFAEQLDALGWTLSYEHRKYSAAAEVFAQAIQWDECDDYAHHYRAFNLDRLGGDRSVVEDHYATAVALNPEHVWWHSRFICFLVIQGRIDDAQQRWNEAQYALGIADGEADTFLYETLHGWTISTLLHRGEISFARKILEDVPDWARSEAAGFGSLERRLEALQEAQSLGAFVPAQRLRARWWADGPSLLQDRLGDGRKLIRWLAGRVETVDHTV